MSMERGDNNGSGARCSLGVVTQSTDRRCGSVGPTDLSCKKDEGMKSSSTEPCLSSAHVEPSHNSNVRYALLIC